MSLEILLSYLDYGIVAVCFIFMLWKQSKIIDRQQEKLDKLAETLERASSTLAHIEVKMDKMEGDIKQLKGGGH